MSQQDTQWPKIPIPSQALVSTRTDDALRSLRLELQRAVEREEVLQRQVAQMGLREGGATGSEEQEAERQVQERFSELLKSIGQQRDRALAEKDVLQNQLNDALKQLQAQAQGRDTGARPAGIRVDSLEADTPLDSPIQMPPFPATPVPHNHNLSSRPTTADTDMWRSRPTTAEGVRPATRDGARSTRPGTADGEGGGTRPTTAEGVREAAEGVGRSRAAEAGEQAAHAAAEVHRLRGRLGEVEEQNTRLRGVVAQMREEMERMTSGRAAALQGGTDEEKEVLIERLRQTEAVLRRVTSERDKLISISNMLRADLKRAQSAAQPQRGPLREVQSSLADLDARGMREDDYPQHHHGAGYGDWKGTGGGGRVREAWGEEPSNAADCDEVRRREADPSSRDVYAMETCSGIEVVEMAMAELVHKNRQMKLELTQMPGPRKRSGLKSKDREKTHNRVGGSSSDTGGLASGIHAYSQADGEWGAPGGASGVRKRLEVSRPFEKRLTA
jgi:hypothetical protein